MTETSEPQEVLRWYTSARRMPTLIGKAVGGGHYPGGPYTVTQAIGAAVVVLGALFTRSAWGRWGPLADNLVIAGAGVVTLFALKLVKPGRRDPFSVLVCAVAVMTGPAWGRHAGKPLRRARDHRIHQNINTTTQRSQDRPRRRRRTWRKQAGGDR